jgi:hypothetical protein
MEKLEEIRERLNKATSGNWCHIPNIVKGRSIFSDPDTRLKIGETYSYNDAVFICCAPDDIKYLLEQITALQEENATLTKALEIALSPNSEHFCPSKNFKIDVECKNGWKADKKKCLKCWMDYTLSQARSANSKEGEKWG